MAQNLDASSIVRAMTLYARALERFRPELDSLNVYPAPDGDTGTNLLHTQRAVVTALGAPEAGRSMRDVGETVATAALTGARGNSGVILSQMLRTLCAMVPDEGADAAALAKALSEAAAAARRAGAEPQEGTVLTVLDAAAAAAESAGSAPDAAAVLEAALGGARRALDATTGILPELRAAGVVDAGGKGAVLLLDALLAGVTGRELTEPRGRPGPVGRTGRQAPAGPPAYSHEVEFLLEAPVGAVGPLRRGLAELGGSLAVVGGDGLYRVHVHTDRPADALAAGRAAGTLLDPSVMSLDARVADCLGMAARGVQAGRPACALVAVVEESEVAIALRSLGAMIVEPRDVRIGLGDALGSTAARGVVVVCAVVAADDARAALAGVRRDGRVVPAPSLPALISAAAEFHPDAGPAVNADAMIGAVERWRGGEIPAATSSGRLVPAATALAAGLVAGAPQAEVLTIVSASGVTDEDVASIATAIEERHPHLRVECLRAGGGAFAVQIGLD